MKSARRKSLLVNATSAMFGRRQVQIQIIGERDLLVLQGKIAQHLPTPMAGVRRDGTLAFVNGALERRFGWVARDLVGRGVQEVLAEVAAGPVPPLQWSVGLAHGREVDVVVRSRQGGTVPVGLTAAPIRMARRTHGFLVLVRDKTALAQSLREARLATAGLLATVAAHEMKNPLQAARGFLQLAQAQGDLSWLACALEGIDEVTETIDQLLVFAKEPVPFPCWVDVRDLFRKVGLFLQHRLGEVRLVEEVGVSRVWGDARLLRQILVNLTANALEACDGRGTVWLRSRAVPSGVCLEVEDTGPGIPAAMLDSIFEPFITTKPEGSGLGLYVSRQVAKAHGGTLSALNRVGGGAVVQLVLPHGPEEP